MSIPGLGQIPIEVNNPSASRRHRLQQLWEWRFEVDHSPITVRLLSGMAERDGTELAPNQPYRFSLTKSKIFTWHGCELEVEGTCDEYISEQGPDTPMVSYFNLHMFLDAQRAAAAAAAAAASGSSSSSLPEGPRVMICGPANSGRTTLVRTLAAWATKFGRQPCVVNADPREGMLSLPGTLSAAVFATIMDIEADGGGWGDTPTSGPSAIPVKLPLVYYHGLARTDGSSSEDGGGENGGGWGPAAYRALTTRLARAAAGRMSHDPDVRASGLLIDAPAVSLSGGVGVDLLAHLVQEFSVNIIVVLGSVRLNKELTRRFAQEHTSLGEPINVVMLDRSDGVVERDDAFLKRAREALIKEYFFGNAKRTLSPYSQQVEFDSLTVYKLPDPSSLPGDASLEKVDSPGALAHWTLAVMNASVRDTPEAVRNASVLGFVYVADADAERRRLKVLAPFSGRLGDRPLLLGRWPEPYVNLLG